MYPHNEDLLTQKLTNEESYVFDIYIKLINDYKVMRYNS